MAAHYTILFLGDVVGRPGREAVAHYLPSLVNEFSPTFLILNGENAAGGIGLTPALARDFRSMGFDAITLGNHAFNKVELESELDSPDSRVVRPINFSGKVPGRGTLLLEKEDIRLLVANVSGRHNMEPWYDDPWAAADALAQEAANLGADLFVDFHAESTSEKVAMGWHLDGRAVAVVGTHTHVQTADARVLPQGTAHISDAGFCGNRDSVLGSGVEGVLARFRRPVPRRLEIQPGPLMINGVIVRVSRETRRATEIITIRRHD